MAKTFFNFLYTVKHHRSHLDLLASQARALHVLSMYNISTELGLPLRSFHLLFLKNNATQYNPLEKGQRRLIMHREKRLQIILTKKRRKLHAVSLMFAHRLKAAYEALILRRHNKFKCGDVETRMPAIKIHISQAYYTYRCV